MLIGHIFATLCLWVACEAAKNPANLETLRFIQTLCRHGDRNPAYMFPTDTGNNESTWKGGSGELTQLGILKEYQLGQFIRKRYEGFLAPNYDAKQVHAQSSGFNRTIASASAILAGLYPPKNDQIWNKNLLWQPIPVHTKNKYDDPVIWMDRPCPKADQLRENVVYKSAEYLAIEKENQEFLEFLREKSGRDSMHLMHITEVLDPLYCEMIYNDTHKWPEWVNHTIFEKMEHLHEKAVQFYYHLPELQRLRGSLLFHEVASRMMEKIRNSQEYIQNLEHFLYSLHDTTQIAVLENLEAFDGVVPTYSQLLVFELHEIEGKFYVELYKRNDTESDDVFPISMPVCGTPCLAEKLFTVSSSKKPENWYEECGLVSPKNYANLAEKCTREHVDSITMLSNETFAILITLLVILFTAFLLVFALFCKTKRANKRMTRGQL